MTHHSARIGGRPEHRDWIWDPERPCIPPEVDPTAYIQPFVTVDAGCEGPTRIGARTLLLAKVHVGHDAQIGADCELAPGAVVCGHAKLGDRVRVGVNASILPFVTVGEGARIGAGAVVTKNVPAGETWVGNPARPISVEALHSAVADGELTVNGARRLAAL